MKSLSVSILLLLTVSAVAIAEEAPMCESTDGTDAVVAAATVPAETPVPQAKPPCKVTEDPEVSCTDGKDNDCDGAADALDFEDCPTGCNDTPTACCARGTLCLTDSECCSNSCKGPQGRKTCR